VGLVFIAAALAQEPALEPVPADPVQDRVEQDASNRKALRRAGAAGVLVGGLWWLAWGDTLNVGDPASLLAGMGLVAMGGAVVGGSVDLLVDGGLPLEHRVQTPPLALYAGPGGTSTLGESAPPTMGLSLGPGLRLGDSALLVLGGDLHGSLGPTVDVDPRVQGDFDASLSQRSWGWDLDPELRLEPGSLAGRGEGNWQLRVRPWVRQRSHSLAYADGTARDFRRSSVAPQLGLHWRLSGRQAFTAYVGPRWDFTSWSEAQDRGALSPRLGPIVGEARYDIHTESLGWTPGGWATRGRLRFSYLHDSFDGQGMDWGAAIGFFGPLVLRYDHMFVAPRRPLGFQVGLGWTLGEGGGVGLQVGLQHLGRER
jgi:hypothetical protein